MSQTRLVELHVLNDAATAAECPDCNLRFLWCVGRDGYLSFDLAEQFFRCPNCDAEFGETELEELIDKATDRFHLLKNLIAASSVESEGVDHGS